MTAPGRFLGKSETVCVRMGDPNMASNPDTDVGKLIAFGQMAFEQGWYDQAREYFEQAIELDATNQEAIDALARMDQILSRKAAMAVEPTKTRIEPTQLSSEETRIGQEGEEVHLETQKERIKVAQRERRWLIGIGAAIVVIVILLGICDSRIVAFLFSAGLAIGAICFIGWVLINFGKWRKKQARERAQKLAWQKEAWAEQRGHRGGAPLQLGQCPECGSMNSKKYKDIGCKGQLAFALTFPLSLLVYPLLPDAYRCKKCGAKWRA